MALFDEMENATCHVFNYTLGWYSIKMSQPGLVFRTGVLDGREVSQSTGVHGVECR